MASVSIETISVVGLLSAGYPSLDSPLPARWFKHGDKQSLVSGYEVGSLSLLPYETFPSVAIWNGTQGIINLSCPYK